MSDIIVLSSSVTVILLVIFPFSKKQTNKKKQNKTKQKKNDWIVLQNALLSHVFDESRLLKNFLRSFLYNLLQYYSCFLYLSKIIQTSFFEKKWTFCIIDLFIIAFLKNFVTYRTSFDFITFFLRRLMSSI